MFNKKYLVWFAVGAVLAGVRAESMKVRATAYCASCARCGTGKRTFTDTIARRGVVAVDPKVIPLGSMVKVPGYGTLRAEDTGGAIKGRRIDICFGTGNHRKTAAFGVRQMNITFTKPKRKRK